MFKTVNVLTAEALERFRQHNESNLYGWICGSNDFPLKSIHPTRGVVLKFNDNLVAKIICGNSDYTEYTSLQYLAEHAPDIPAPNPHGLVKFDSASVMFMTCFPSTTLEKAWSATSPITAKS
jgi:hypothetical protein